jgi:DNA-binding transcriptional ArsR family regulator
MSTQKTAREKKRALGEDQLDLVFGALADRTRRALLARLALQPAMVTELAAPFSMSLPAVSRHVRVLERAQLVVRTVDGRIHQCALDAAPLQTAGQWLNHYQPFWENKLDALARYVDNDPHPKPKRR